MANRLKMADIQAVTALLQQGWSQRRIARELGLDRETVARYAQRWRQLTAKPANLRPGSEAGDAAKPANLRLGSEAADGLGAEAQDPLLAGLPDVAMLGAGEADEAGQQSACWPFRELI